MFLCVCECLATPPNGVGYLRTTLSLCGDLYDSFLGFPAVSVLLRSEERHQMIQGIGQIIYKNIQDRQIAIHDSKTNF